MQKLTYVKPTVTKMGSVTEKTEGGWNYVVWEIMSKRGGGSGN